MADCRFNIDFRDIPSIPEMLKDYLDGNLSAYHGLQFSKDNSLVQANKKSRNYPSKHREVLTEVLTKQMRNIAISAKQMQNIELLRKENTFTVTTGHQLNLFTGPVFFIYKILQTIKTAKYLNENNEGKNFVPVFWMATEDHDFDEINHFKTEGNFYQIQEKSGGAVGRIKSSDLSFLDLFEKEFKDFTYGTELVRWAKEAYQEGRSLTLATRILVNRIFGDSGLLILNGDDKKLKALAAPVFRKELLENSLYENSKETVDVLVNQYGKVQANPREINLFYLRDESRDRIEKAGASYHVVDTDISFTEEEILAELNANPQRFSPNAVLRPAYQETVLPNIIYIGGNAEIMYWLELKKFFEAIDVEFPILVPRNSLAFITEKTLRKIKKLDLCVEDFFGNYQEVVHSKLLGKTSLQPLLEEKEENIKSMFSELKKQAETTDKTFSNLVAAEEVRQLKSFERMHKRLLRAEKIVQADLYQRYNQLYEVVNPAGVWQERKINFSNFYAENGRDWLKTCYENIEVAHPELTVVVL
ncbi:bacillithiol biosynthesis cysteine-adding enzyme BshC [Elizabethkingia anophelis]|uniref:bacillithiol biosynthesis cysteine-adding enzyme BshC n=1 Tax=Elizabethkingia anophelis TaxID=1117645 RepID=UPI00222686FC|nr:bacillithiol biosynthesis cysteine-adding enzyme BshC [Elizabethkingia anophelis]MCW2464630.1 bacillithiol biosynthesis cysteine-adding enzyme BshC [Elizabethkingia anophelis]MCW2468313.1 bacillithiol biosynthesis cysteine-adding enzyme BshC [Elizabethkingia anophelis]MCW2471997.1 bacillithiol biosynthesis cysteine-adding enzyme BshC [Elizabethkingia anophelis]HBI9691759.1 bacillithiol biosynthesis cysteine-adding enzyme BshC [Elizabethkingia anophelis]HBI9695778.1 bacillithiol biosynthesis